MAIFDMFFSDTIQSLENECKRLQNLCNQLSAAVRKVDALEDSCPATQHLSDLHSNVLTLLSQLRAQYDLNRKKTAENAEDIAEAIAESLLKSDAFRPLMTHLEKSGKESPEKNTADASDPNERIRKLEDENQKLQKDNRTWRLKYDQRSREAEEAKKQSNQAELARLQKENEKLKTGFMELRAELESATSSSEQLGRQNADLIRADQINLATIEQLQEDSRQLKDELRASSEKQKELNQHIQDQQKTIEVQRSEIERLRKRLHSPQIWPAQQEKEPEEPANSEFAVAAESDEETAAAAVPLSAEHNPYILSAGRDECFYRPDNPGEIRDRFGNTMMLDAFFNELGPDHIYSRMYQRFSRRLRKELNGMDYEAEPDEILRPLLDIIEKDLLEKIMIAIHSAQENGDADIENQLLLVLNTYLDSIGFYTGNDVVVGNQISEQDYEDMEVFPAPLHGGEAAGQIVEVELRPYYINYLDLNMQRERMHTRGRVIVAADEDDR